MELIGNIRVELHVSATTQLPNSAKTMSDFVEAVRTATVSALHEFYTEDFDVTIEGATVINDGTRVEVVNS
jgi:hypothetical protein